MGAKRDDVERRTQIHRVGYVLLWLSIAFAISRASIFYRMTGERRTDLNLYRGYAQKILEGEIPYKDFFPEYPPLALQFLTLPTIVDPSLKWYFGLYRAVCCLVDCAMWVALVRAYKDGRVRGHQPLLYILGTTALGALIYDRLDIALGAVLLFAALSLMDCERTRFHLAVGVGIALKLIPVIFVPAALAFEARKNDRFPFRALLLLMFPTAASFGVLAVLGGYRFDKLFGYHIERDIEIESTLASIEMVLMDFGLEGAVTRGFGSHNLNTPVDQILARGATALLGLVILGTALFAARRNPNTNMLAILFAAILAWSLLLSKVLSPQYFLFLLPVLVVIPECQSKLGASATWLLVAMICGLTGVIYPGRFDALTKLEPNAELILLIRNEYLAALALSLLYRAWVSHDDDGGGSETTSCTTAEANDASSPLTTKT